MTYELRTAVFKGRKADINAVLKKSGMATDVEEVEPLANGLVVYRVNLGDVSRRRDMKDSLFTRKKNVKFLILAKNEEEKGDTVIFKQFGSSKVYTAPAFDPAWFSTYMEEFEGNELPFMDMPFEIEIENYADRKFYTVRNSMYFGAEWRDDTGWIWKEPK